MIRVNPGIILSGLFTAVVAFLLAVWPKIAALFGW